MTINRKQRTSRLWQWDSFFQCERWNTGNFYWCWSDQSSSWNRFICCPRQEPGCSQSTECSRVYCRHVSASFGGGICTGLRSECRSPLPWHWKSCSGTATASYAWCRSSFSGILCSIAAPRASSVPANKSLKLWTGGGNWPVNYCVWMDEIWPMFLGYASILKLCVLTLTII